MSIATTAAAVPAAITSPIKTAKTHPLVVFAVLILLTMVAVVAIEARRPGAVKRFVEKTFGRIPFVGPKIMGA